MHLAQLNEASLKLNESVRTVLDPTAAQVAPLLQGRSGNMMRAWFFGTHAQAWRGETAVHYDVLDQFPELADNGVPVRIYLLDGSDRDVKVEVTDSLMRTNPSWAKTLSDNPQRVEAYVRRHPFWTRTGLNPVQIKIEDISDVLQTIQMRQARTTRNESELNEDTGLFGRADNYGEIATRLKRAGYRMLKRVHHGRIWVKYPKAILVYVKGEQAMTDYLKFCKGSTNKHTPRIRRGPVDVSPQHAMVGFDHLHDIKDSRWKKVMELEDYSQSNHDQETFDSVYDEYPSLWRLMEELHRRGFFQRFDFDLDRESWMEYETQPVLFAPFWTTRAGMFRE